MIDCYKYQNISKIIYLPCHDFNKLFSTSLWHNLLLIDYLGLTVVTGLLILAVYLTIRQSRWQSLCAGYVGFRNQNGNKANGEPRYRYAKINVMRRYWIFGEIRSVTIYGFDTVTPTNVEAARQAISNFVGVELSPPSTGVGPVRLEVNHLVAKKNPFNRRLGQ